MIDGMSKLKYWLGFIGILVLATSLRFYKLGQVPVSLYWDEAAMLLDSKVVSQTGYDMHGNPWWQALFPSYGDFKLPIYIWLASLSVKVIGLSELAIRLPSALVGIATVIMAGLIARELFSKNKDKLQLAAMLAVTVSPWSIMFSRTAFEGHLGQLILAGSILMILKAKDKPWLIWLSPFLGALATYTYFSVRFVWPVIFVATAILILKKKSWKFIISGLAIFGLLLLPMFKSPLYEASNQFRYSTTSVLNAQDYPVESNQYRQLAGSSLIDRALFHRHYLVIRELLKNYADNLSLDYLFATGDPNLRHGTGDHGLFLLIFLPVLMVGLYQLFKNKRWELVVLLVWWLIALLPASVPEDTPHSLRSLNALMPISLILGFGLVSIFEYKYKIVSWLTAILIVLNLFQFTYHYLTQYPADSAYDWQDGYKEMALEINENLPSVADVYINNFDDRFYLWLLAYGDYSAAEIQALPKEKFQVKKLDKITFGEYHWHKVDSLDRKILVVGLKESIDQGIKDYKIKPTWEKEIAQANGQVPFKVVMIESQF